jgi:aminoglycoside/choline kinase family phosphotransferase
VRTELEEYTGRVLGPHTVVGDRSWDHGEACVLEVRAADDTTWFAKRHRGEKTYVRELTAYRSWVPALGDRAPRLRASDEDLRAIVVSKVEGVIRLDAGPDDYHQAGALLRRFHTAEPAQPWPDYAAHTRDRLEHWIARGGELLERRQADFARAEIAALAGVPAPARVPCHRDYTPRNWLVDGAGVLRVIDFGHARRDVWVNDLNRLAFDQWVDRADLEDAFLDGYGRLPDAVDRALLRVWGILGAVSSIVWAREHHDTAFEAHHRALLDQLMARQ